MLAKKPRGSAFDVLTEDSKQRIEKDKKRPEKEAVEAIKAQEKSVKILF
jgi:hypothetical protein